MEKSNSDDDSVEKSPQPVINISSNTDLSDDSNDSLTISAGKPTRFVILQYVVERDVPFFTNVHGNTKTANTPYVRTSKRVLADNGVGKRAKETFDVIFEDAGGMMHVSSPLELPRNTKQINNVKQTQKGAVAGKEKDSMFQLIKACKDQQSLADPYIRLVQCAAEFCCICSSDLQLMEMDMFLTNPSECTIMGIDPTFNLGEFVVTPIVYKNLKLIHRRTGECPTFLGPVLIHQTKTEGAFDFFASSIVSLRNTLADKLFIGTDDECSIFNSFSRHGRYMPISKNMQCQRHVRLNLERKLHVLGINNPYTNQFIKDIFDKNVGLADCLTDTDFEKKNVGIEANLELERM
ncbi:unnamed protein product [Mytilus coruscus]|uniref:MULE transposase domain-containing protein n=1 Tax=Mytilus coruscus TaxID=42192 RepID=A0A6J8CFR3_MYTCO|nr:unnamed protein product [Mytilus coruscus]